MVATKCLILAFAALQLVHISQCRYVNTEQVVEEISSELSCSDNATCINDMTQKLIRGVRESKTVRMFNMVTIEPMQSAVGEGRSNEGSLAKFFNTHSFKFDFGNYGIRVARAANKDSSVVFEVESNVSRFGEGRGRGKKVMQMFLPLMLGFKAASTLVVAIAAVALLTFKAFVASKLALIVTITMVVRKFLASYGGSSIGQSPYMYSQYPVDFPTGAAHAGYSSMGGAAGYPSMGSTGYSSAAAPELYSLSGINSLQQPAHAQDATGQYSQNIAEIHNSNATSKFVPTAGKRWDGYKKRPMYYESSKYSNDGNSGYQEYEP